MMVSIAIIVFVPHSVVQIFLLFVLWAITFPKLQVYEVVVFVITCIFFTLADITVITKGVFQFTQTDIWNMPYYEPFVWGFYFLHAVRMLGVKEVHKIIPGLVFALAFTLPISLVQDEVVTLTLSGLVLLVGLSVFRTKNDFVYTLYFVLLGCIIEFVGTQTGTWYYGIEHYYAWWVITWGGSGLILYRTLIPVSMYCARLLKKF